MAGQDPVGKRMQMGGDDTPLMQVVGVVGDVRGISLDKPPTMTVYVPYWQRFQSQALLAVRTPLDPAAIAPDVRRALRAVDPELPLPAFRTMEEIVSVSIAERRFQTNLVMLFGLVAALLASLGSTGWCRTRSRSARVSSASAWRWAPFRRACAGWSCDSASHRWQSASAADYWQRRSADEC